MLPIHCYDESGVIKPPGWLYVLMLLCCMDWLIVVFALAVPRQTEHLLSVFFAGKWLMFSKLAASLPCLLAMILISQRQRLWHHGYYGWRIAVLPLLTLGCVIATAMLVIQLLASHWQFEWFLALGLLMYPVFLAVLWRSFHLRLMIADWSKENFDIR
ncbi:DUF2919 family protein [Alteromonas aestuariivivens]|uniref:DUF2919 family protein n=1 Tax=Alteromonas aestuariivivens TaxID=1938339 RepID=UPI0015F24839|nr:DUF2919 family protein [Alteromonas aestuariivivens]